MENLGKKSKELRKKAQKITNFGVIHIVRLFHPVRLSKLGDLPPCAFIPSRAFIRDCILSSITSHFLERLRLGYDVDNYESN